MRSLGIYWHKSFIEDAIRYNCDQNRRDEQAKESLDCANCRLKIRTQ
jgi:hypothetical protein